MSEVELEMLDTSFSNFNPVEFAKLMRASHWESVDINTTLTTEKEVPQKLYFVQNGSISVTRDSKEIARTSDGTFIGEMSFINDTHASATTTTLTPTNLVVWDRQALNKLLLRNPTLSILLKSIAVAAFATDPIVPFKKLLSTLLTRLSSSPLSLSLPTPLLRLLRLRGTLSPKLLCKSSHFPSANSFRCVSNDRIVTG